MKLPLRWINRLFAAYNGTQWMIALHRSLKISAGIVVGLVMTVLWPEESEARTGSRGRRLKR